MRLSLALLLGLALAACADDAPAAGPVAAAYTVGVDSLVDADPARAYRVAIGYPQIEGMRGGPLPDALAAANALLADTVAALAARLRPEAPPPGVAPVNAVTVTGSTTATFLSDAVFSALVTVATDAGGMGPTTFALPITIDLATGAAVAPADLFAAGTPWADTLAAHVGRGVERAVRARGEGAFFAAGLDPLRAGRVDLTLGPEDAVVHLPAGQAASGDTVGFAVEVPLRALAPFVRAGSALARHPAL